MPTRFITAPSPTEQAVAHIAAHWKEGKTLKEIAVLYRLNEGNLARAFRSTHGQTVKGFVDQHRRAFVAERVQHDGALGYELASDLGFRNDMSFYRWAKRVFGTSFKQVREDLKDRHSQTVLVQGTKHPRKRPL